MGVRSKIAPLLLAVVLMAGNWEMRQFLLSVQLPEHAMGCHEHGNSSPRQTPVHDCCLTGHDVAFPQFSNTEYPLAECHPHLGLPCAPPPTDGILGILADSSLSSPESPGITPLRI
jgi:hypothetical protein